MMGDPLLLGHYQFFRQTKFLIADICIALREIRTVTKEDRSFRNRPCGEKKNGHFNLP